MVSTSNNIGDLFDKYLQTLVINLRKTADGKVKVEDLKDSIKLEEDRWVSIVYAICFYLMFFDLKIPCSISQWKNLPRCTTGHSANKVYAFTLCLN
jgi:hypothetical protein